MNIHDHYPTFKAFDPYTVTEFYALKARHHIALEEYEIARKCVDTVKQLSSRKARLLHTMVSYAADPSFRRKAKFVKSLFVILLLSILGGAVWGIIQLLRWIF